MTSLPPSNNFPRKITSAKLSVAALIVGLLLGAAIKSDSVPLLSEAASVVEPLGQIWMRLLQMIVVPLVITQLLLTIGSMRHSGTMVRLGGITAMCFVVLFVLGAALAIFAGPQLIRLVQFDSESVSALNLAIPDAAKMVLEDQKPASVSDALVNLAPTNLAKAVADGQLLQLILLTVVFGVAIARVNTPHRQRILVFLQAISSVVVLVTAWILRFTPLGVFALAITVARQSGIDIIGVLIQFVVIISGMLLAFVLVLYFVAVVIGGVSFRSFAMAAYPSQLIAISTRSSLATIPTLVVGASQILRLPKHVVDFTIPFSAATFKANRTISSTTKLLFLAYIFGVPLSFIQILVFVGFSILLSFSSVGVPGGGGSFRALPLYLALGIPIEGLILAETVDVIPDVFKTLVNTTGFLAVATIVARLDSKFENCPVDDVYGDSTTEKLTQRHFVEESEIETESCST